MELLVKKTMPINEYKKLVEQDRPQSKDLNENERQIYEGLQWRGKSYLYGSDVAGSLFRKDSKFPWNLQSLKSVLNDGLGRKTLKGITEPYLYIGGYATMFAWHVEDYNLPSINFLHFGEPKIWYVISREDYKKFEKFVKGKFPSEYVQCPQFLRHKTVIINPYFVKENCPDIRIFKVQQNAGEFVVTFNSGYHTGFNMGFNVAEAVNFATPNWLPEFPLMKHCKCQKGNLVLDVDAFKENLVGTNRYQSDKNF